MAIINNGYTIHVGDQPTVAVSFTVHNGTTGQQDPTDPTTITLKIEAPDGTQTTYTYALTQVTREALGNYSRAVALNQAGDWHIRWEGTGACVAAVEGDIHVEATQF